jgi:uncharacterized protein YndB with AHSA1/START domain
MTAPEPGAPAVVVRRVLPAPPDVVFAAWLDPESVREWMTPAGTAELTLDPHPGGAFRLVMSGGGTEIEHTGKYRAIVPPELLQFTWRSRFTDDQETLVTVRLTPRGDGCTELELVHELLTVEQAGSHSGGWRQIVDRLAEHLLQVRGHGR